MMGEIERSPVLAAPSFNTFLGANSNEPEVGEDEDDLQAANDLCKNYRPLALKIAAGYRNKGVSTDDLHSAAMLGLVRASRKFDQRRGAFGPYAKLWIRGELTGLFKPTADALSKPPTSLDSSPESEDGETLSLHEKVADDCSPGHRIDLSETTEVERRILVGRSGGESLQEIGRTSGLAPSAFANLRRGPPRR
jgi:RNA polymerase sigma factor (sigma-70 family)